MTGGHEHPPAASPTLAKRQLGHELRRIREQTGKTGDRVARELSWSPSKISRAELAKIIPAPGEVAKLLSYYQITGPQHDCLLQLAHTAHQTCWWHNYTADLPAHQLELIGLEDAAADILTWAADMVPALLQTHAYARHVTDSYRRIEPIAPQQASRHTAVTMRRQELLTRDNPPQVTVVLAEAALRRPADHPQVMPQQLHHLAALANGHPALVVHVLPMACPQPVFTGSFTVLGFGPAEDGLPDVVALDHLTSGCLIDDEREAYLYRLTHQHLASGALDPAQSRSLLHQIASSSPASLAPVAGTGPIARWPRAADG